MIRFLKYFSYVLFISVLIIVFSSCVIEPYEPGYYTIKVKTYYEYPIYSIEYKETEAFEWTEASLEDWAQNPVTNIEADEYDINNEAYFDVPDLGTYSFRGWDSDDWDEAFEVFYIEDCQVVYDASNDYTIYYLEIAEDGTTYWGELSYGENY